MRQGNIACFNFLYYGKVPIAHILRRRWMRICFSQRKGNWDRFKFIIIRERSSRRVYWPVSVFRFGAVCFGCPAFYQTAIAIQRKFRSEIFSPVPDLRWSGLYNHFLPWLSREVWLHWLFRRILWNLSLHYPVRIHLWLPFLVMPGSMYTINHDPDPLLSVSAFYHSSCHHSRYGT